MSIDCATTASSEIFAATPIYMVNLKRAAVAEPASATTISKVGESFDSYFPAMLISGFSTSFFLPLGKTTLYTRPIDETLLTAANLTRGFARVDAAYQFSRESWHIPSTAMSMPFEISVLSGILRVSTMSYSKKVSTAKDRTARDPVRNRVRRHRTNKMIAQAAQLRDGERQCKCIIKKTGKRCKQFSIKGGFVCMFHGGSAPQVRAKANLRLLALVEPSLVRLGDLVQQSEHMPTALGAIRTVLERAGTITPIGPLGKDTGDRDMRPIVNIGIALGGLTPDKLKLLALASNHDVIDVTPKPDDDDE